MKTILGFTYFAVFITQLVWAQTATTVQDVKTIRNVEGILLSLPITKINCIKVKSHELSDDFLYFSKAVLEIDLTILGRHLKEEDKLILTKTQAKSDKNTSFFSPDLYNTFEMGIHTIESQPISISSGTQAMLGYYNGKDYKRVQFELVLDFTSGADRDNSKTYELRFPIDNEEVVTLVARVDKENGWSFSLNGKTFH